MPSLAFITLAPVPFWLVSNLIQVLANVLNIIQYHTPFLRYPIPPFFTQHPTQFVLRNVCTMKRTLALLFFFSDFDDLLGYHV